jgi:hypothetical protein
MFSRSLFVLLSFFFCFWPLCCLSFFCLRILITPLVSSLQTLLTSWIAHSKHSWCFLNSRIQNLSKSINFWKNSIIYDDILVDIKNLIYFAIFSNLWIGWAKKSIELLASGKYTFLTVSSSNAYLMRINSLI